MSTTVTLQANKSARIDRYNPNTNFSSETLEKNLTFSNYIIYGFEAPPSSLLYRQIANTAHPITIPCAYDQLSFYPFDGYPITGSWIENTVCYNNVPNSLNSYQHASANYNRIVLNGGSHTFTPPEMENILKYGLKVYCTSNYDAKDVGLYTTRASSIPSISVTFLDTNANLYVSSASPSSGFTPRNQSKLFSWEMTKNGSCYGEITLTSANIQWKTSPSGTVNTISCGAVTSYTVPANTFNADTIYWRVQATDSTGYTSCSDWYQLSTVDVTSSAECLSPKNSVIDGSVATVFSWAHIISTGTDPTGAELQRSTNNSSWSSLTSVSTGATSVTVGAGTFASGQHYWRVRTKNSSGVYGNWSESVSFVAISAPATPIVSSTQEPRPTISWQASDQQGYQVKVGGVYDSGTKFGTASSFRLPMYLDDGAYTVAVRVRNSYGIWSAWGTAPLTVQNTPGTAIVLSYVGQGTLSWTGNYYRYALYRDGALIALTSDNSYKDICAVGRHSYYVRGLYENSSNYGISNTLNANIEVDCVTINDIDSGISLALKLSTSSYAESSVSESINDVLTHITGSAYPMVETSSFKNKSIRFNVAFSDESDRDAFVSMFGHKVSVLSPKGTAVVGMLSALSRTESTFYTNYSCSVTQIAEDVITL